MAFQYTQVHLDFLRETYKTHMNKDLTAAFNQEFELNKTPGEIRSTLKNHKILSGRAPGVIKGTLKNYTKKQDQFIRENYKKLTIEKLTIAYNEKFHDHKTSSQIRAFTRNHAIKSGRLGHFQKNSTPWNKNTKGLLKSNKTSFKKGDIPVNIKPIGHERIDSKDGYILIKVEQPNPYTGAPTRYRAKHQVIWEAEHGPIPEGHIVQFIDGIKANCYLSNLMLLSRAESCYLNKNGYWNLPDELKPTMLALAKMTRQQKLVEQKLEESI